MRKPRRRKPRNAIQTRPQAQPDGQKPAQPQVIPPEILERLPANVQGAVVEAALFQGPLPPPALFKEYDQVVPGAAERILALAENNQSHRTSWETIALTEQANEVRRGQYMGFALAFGMLIGAVFCAHIGQPWVAGALVASSMAGVVTAFLRGREPSGP